MSKDTFPFTPTSLRALKMEQEFQDWEDARRALAQRRALTRAPLPRAPRPPPRQRRRRLQEVRAPPSQAQCRDKAIHNTFMYGDMKGVYAVLKDPAMVNALMEIAHEEMVWASEMGMWTLKTRVKQTSALRLAACRGRAACVEELLFRGAEVNSDPGGHTALHDACTGGHADCVRLLLSHGADPELPTADGSAALHLCNSVQSFHCAELLLEAGADVDVRMKETRLTPLHMAAQRGLEEQVALFLRHRADVLVTNREGETPLNAACSQAERPSESKRYLRVIQMLLDAGADPRTAGRKQHTPLHNACANCCAAIVDVLLQHGARADVKNCAGYTPMDCLLQVVEDYLDQQPEAVARSLLNHGAKSVPPKTLKQCAASPATLEVLLNSHTSIPPCDWLDSLPDEIYQEHQAFFDLVRQRSAQPRSLQHLSRCAVRLHLGARCHSAITELDIARFLKAYVLLCNDGTLQ